MKRIVIAKYDAEGQGIPSQSRHGFYETSMEADTIETAKVAVASAGYKLVDFDAPEHAPGEYFGDEQDALCVNVYAS